jgi:Ala-tRNA(Pro) deacylase
MSIPSTIERFLDEHHVKYEVVRHPRAYTSLGTALAAHIEPDRVLKAVLLEDNNGYLVAVVPATCHVKLGVIRRETGRAVHLATEGEVRERFPDCDPGAVPALGPAYGVETLWDDSLMERSDIYFEAGDHERLVHLSAEDLVGLLGASHHGRFGKRFVH